MTSNYPERNPAARRLRWTDAQTSFYYAVTALIAPPLAEIFFYFIGIAACKPLLLAMTAAMAFSGVKAILFGLDSFLRSKEFANNRRHAVKAVLGIILGLCAFFLALTYAYWILLLTPREIQYRLDSFR
ncbi:MAG: hypothetical protein PHT59_00555 [Candidatus Omnitrophica bacterium]|nr:hypothetical protein [Candidatus Omnitrophota bacterium]